MTPTLLFLFLFVAALLGVLRAALPIVGRGRERNWHEIRRRRAWPLPEPTVVRPDRFPAKVQVDGLRPGQSVHVTMHPTMITESAEVTPHPPGFRWDGTPKPPKPITFDPEGLYVYTVDAVGGVTKHPISDPSLQAAVRSIAAAEARRRSRPEPRALPPGDPDLVRIWEKLGQDVLAQHERNLRGLTAGVCEEHSVRTLDGTVIPTPVLGCATCGGLPPFDGPADFDG